MEDRIERERKREREERVGERDGERQREKEGEKRVYNTLDIDLTPIKKVVLVCSSVLSSPS